MRLSELLEGHKLDKTESEIVSAINTLWEKRKASILRPINKNIPKSEK